MYSTMTKNYNVTGFLYITTTNQFVKHLHRGADEINYSQLNGSLEKYCMWKGQNNIYIYVLICSK